MWDTFFAGPGVTCQNQSRELTAYHGKAFSAASLENEWNVEINCHALSESMRKELHERHICDLV